VRVTQAERGGCTQGQQYQVWKAPTEPSEEKVIYTQAAML